MKTALLFTLATLVFGGVLFAQVANPSNPSSSTMGSANTRESSGVADQLKRLEDEWARAAMTKDRATINRIVADDYVFVTPDGHVVNKTQELDSLAKSNYTDFSNRDMQVRVFGDTAEVIGITHCAGTENGHAIDGDFRFTDVFVNKGGKWQAVSTQATMIQQSNAQATNPPQR